MIDNYKLNLSHQEMKDVGFHYDFELEDYTYEFPVYKINNKASIVCKLGIDKETNKVWLNVYDINGNLYSSYYNRTYGISKIISIIDKNIQKELNRLGAKKCE